MPKVDQQYVIIEGSIEEEWLSTDFYTKRYMNKPELYQNERYFKI